MRSQVDVGFGERRHGQEEVSEGRISVKEGYENPKMARPHQLRTGRQFTAPTTSCNDGQA